MNRFWLTIFFNTFLVGVASAQTACPVGVPPGSPQCGPDSGTSRGDAPASPPRPTGEWIKTWGAIARSNSTGEAGSAVGKLSEREAQQAAIRQCALGGAGDCEVRLSYQNQCAALVSSKSRSFYQSSATEKIAIELAVKACEESNSGSCEVAYSECSKPIFRKF
ncbi:MULTISPECIES: DUF4189 domain-containing protein [Xanthomonas]|uniref:DUF4189 domain-containing protein n=1 Tax=Xanthomonas TaxID=338 RepID=UPI000997F3D3|nr:MULTISPECIES: DUF4189 domain-containing protein [Xanthomonas]MBE0315817.1 DUF4189 domain-containing protein [Xanthomonas citri pv. punicae]PNV26901.1 DUF4189 domain-containing protein [Xanthomonas citri]QCZ72485.1 DUF4189 domain-containing protein [Xanthomonas citri pv. punicae]WPM75184.1 DUF4189 domain-containing protein [Xanthomonas citri pv. viticola]